MSYLYGIKVVVDEHCLASRWHFPKERFVEYEDKDESWCRMFGFGYETFEPACYEIRPSAYARDH